MKNNTSKKKTDLRYFRM